MLVAYKKKHGTNLTTMVMKMTFESWCDLSHARFLIFENVRLLLTQNQLSQATSTRRIPEIVKS
jgi:hypothetical protein